LIHRARKNSLGKTALSLFLGAFLLASVFATTPPIVGVMAGTKGIQDLLAPTIQGAYAVGGIVDGTTCGTVFSGAWESSTNTCAIGTITINSAETLTIPSGTTVRIANSANTRITNVGTLENYGTILVANNANSGSSIGVKNSGTLNNYGTISISNSDGQFTQDTIGIDHLAGATLFNYGTITISSVGHRGIDTTLGSTVTNMAGGSIIITKTDGIAILSRGDFVNNGEITIATTLDAEGISVNLGGSFTNNSGAVINVSNSRSNAAGGGTVYGLKVSAAGPNVNHGTINISTVRTATVGGAVGGILATGPFTNAPDGAITISNSGVSGGMTGNSIENLGTIMISNTNGDGLTGVISNSGTISVSNTNGDGMQASHSGSITNNPGGTILISNSGGTGLASTGNISNSGTITISNTGGDGVRNSLNSAGTNSMINHGTITISNSAGTGLRNGAGAIIDNPGSIYNCGGTYAGTVPTSGNPVIECEVPTISISSPTDGTFLTSQEVSVGGTASDSGGIQKVEVQVDEGEFALATGTDNWSYEISTLSEGSHTITAKATNTAGFSRTASVTVIITFDIVPPTVVVTSPDHNSFVNSVTPTIAGTADDGAGSGIHGYTKTTSGALLYDTKVTAEKVNFYDYKRSSSSTAFYSFNYGFGPTYLMAAMKNGYGYVKDWNVSPPATKDWFLSSRSNQDIKYALITDQSFRADHPNHEIDANTLALAAPEPWFREEHGILLKKQVYKGDYVRNSNDCSTIAQEVGNKYGVIPGTEGRMIVVGKNVPLTLNGASVLGCAYTPSSPNVYVWAIVKDYPADPAKLAMHEVSHNYGLPHVRNGPSNPATDYFTVMHASINDPMSIKNWSPTEDDLLESRRNWYPN
jgi:hypothetical protein